MTQFIQHCVNTISNAAVSVECLYLYLSIPVRVPSSLHCQNTYSYHLNIHNIHVSMFKSNFELALAQKDKGGTKHISLFFFFLASKLKVDSH